MGVIGEIRQAAGMTQAEVAARMGVTEATVSRWDLGHNKPPKRIRRKLAKVLGVEVADLGL